MYGVCFYVLAGISKYYLSSTVPAAVTMDTSTGFSSCAALKNVKLTYNAVSLMGAAGPQCCSAAKTSASHILVNSLYSAVLLSTLSSDCSEWLLVLATIIISIGSTKYSFVFCISKRYIIWREEALLLHCFCFPYSVSVRVRTRKWNSSADSVVLKNLLVSGLFSKLQQDCSYSSTTMQVREEVDAEIIFISSILFIINRKLGLSGNKHSGHHLNWFGLWTLRVIKVFLFILYYNIGLS